MAKLPYGIERIEALKYKPGFFEHVADLQERHGLSVSQTAAQIMAEYGIKTWLRPVLLHFIETGGEIDPTLADEPVKITKDGIYGPAHLILAQDITQPILKEYITKNWTAKIKPAVSLLPNSRHTPEDFPERDEKIYQEYLERKKTGRTIIGIAYRYNVSESTVKRIVRVKKRA